MPPCTRCRNEQEWCKLPKRGLLVQVKPGAKWNPLTHRGMAFTPPDSKGSCWWGWAPHALGKNLLFWTPFTPIPGRGRLQGDPPAYQLYPSWYTPWWPWSPQPWSKCMGASLSQPMMWLREGNNTEYRPLCWASLGACPCPLLLQTHWYCAKGIQSPDIGPSTLFLKWVGLVFPGLGVQYSPISRGSQSPWGLGSSILSLLSEFEGQFDNSRMESNNELQAFQLLTTYLNILFCLCLLMLFHWDVFINSVTINANNPSPCFKGLGQWTIRAVEESLQRVQAHIHELERKVEMADGKVQAHYQEQLKELERSQETLWMKFPGWWKRGRQAPLNWLSLSLHA